MGRSEIDMRGVYLLHFSKPYVANGTRNGKQMFVQHYIGYADNIERRVFQHRRGNGAANPLCRAALAQGAELLLAKVWEDADRTFERGLKNKKHTARFCPICKGEHNGE